ncbi:site-specific integrase [Bacteroides sp. 519]|uniref:site-specific integrase n=1 Tax=Bacteroides sp. 519 TaxID=2302937 RepID=UPI0013D14B67|nr:site-specific integrase [Bacteroides sp. 519]
MSLSEFVIGLADDYKLHGRYRTAETYLTTLRSMLLFHKNEIELHNCFAPDWLLAYQKHLINSGLSQNTVVFYISHVRAMYNKAVKNGLVESQSGLFDHLHTKTVPTLKRAVSGKVISTISEADFSSNSGLEFARDMFMLSFYLQGIAYIDLAHLLKTDVYNNNTIVYRRRKTTSTVHVAVDSVALKIIRKYESKTANLPYLLPILNSTNAEDTQRLYSSSLRTYNRRLKKIAAQLNIEENLTSYVSRHSWATIAYHEGVPTAVISQAMGHQSEEVTHVYLKSFDQPILLRANQAVINAVLKMSSKQQVQSKKNKPPRSNWQNDASGG